MSLAPHEIRHQTPIRPATLYRFEADFRPGPRRQAELRPELIGLLHEAFINHPAYDAQCLPEFLESDIFLRGFLGDELAGIFTVDLFRVQGQPVAHLSVALVAPGCRSDGALMDRSMALSLDLASQAFGSDHFFAALRTANPRVVGRLWHNQWVRYYPRPNLSDMGPEVMALLPHFSAQAFGQDTCDTEGIIFYDIYPTAPWRGQVPWHHDPAVNDFCRKHLRPVGTDAFLFMGPTRPPFSGMPRGEFEWPWDMV